MSESRYVTLLPNQGDEVVYSGGLLKYEVTSTGGPDSYVNLLRTTTHREEPYERRAYYQVPSEIWKDLVSFAATVNPVKRRSANEQGSKDEARVLL